jgi:EcsC protein family
MNTAAGTRHARLTPYEAEQVGRIAAWKSDAPSPVTELWKRISLPVASAIEKLIPDSVVRAAVTSAYDASDFLAGEESVKRRAGVRDLAELKHRPLEDCDALARAAGARAQVIALVEGFATGAGGVLTTLLDVPLLFGVAIGSIRKIGHCYGYPLKAARDRHFVIGVLIASMAGWVEVRRQRINQLGELEDLLIEEIQEDILVDEALSFLFQLEIFEGVPGIGATSGAALNWLFMRRVDETARMVFQERWLRDNGKVEQIEPAEVHARALAAGWVGALSRAAYSGFYCVGFGISLPVYTAAALFRPMDNALTRGVRDGAAAAVARAGRAAVPARGAMPSPNGPKTAPALLWG